MSPETKRALTKAVRQLDEVQRNLDNAKAAEEDQVARYDITQAILAVSKASGAASDAASDAIKSHKPTDQVRALRGALIDLQNRIAEIGTGRGLQEATKARSRAAEAAESAAADISISWIDRATIRPIASALRNRGRVDVDLIGEWLRQLGEVA